jgi:hypothetical protein
MPLDREFWESLDVSIEDIIENETKLDSVQDRLTNKLNKISTDFFPLIKHYYSVQGSTLKDVMQSLFNSSLDNFREVYAIATFGESQLNSEMIYEIAKQRLKGEPIEGQIKSGKIDATALLIPLYKKDPQTFFDIHYASIIVRKASNRFEIQSKLTAPMPFKTLNGEKLNAILQDFENDRIEKNKQQNKRLIKLWWFKLNEDGALVVFRREKRARSEINKVDKNEFLKTGDQKVLIFKDGGNSLEISQASELMATAKIAEYIAKKLSRQTVKYDLVISDFEPKDVDNFLEKLFAGNVKDCALLSLKARNVVDLKNTPTLELSSEDNLLPSLEDLEEHGVSLRKSCYDVLNLRIKLVDRQYTLRTALQDGKIKFLLDNRHIKELEKDTLRTFLKQQIG